MKHRVYKLIQFISAALHTLMCRGLFLWRCE